MKRIELKTNDLLIIDPCYIKHVGDKSGEARYDALRNRAVIHDGDDGEFTVKVANHEFGCLGVDSGRIWVLQAEFDCYVDVDSGLSGEIHIESNGQDMDKVVDKIYVEA